MFKKIISIVFIGLIFVPSLAFASEYVTENFEEALTEESIEHDLKDYKESEDKINIYLFRGHKCGFCNRFLTFLYNNVEEYGKYFNLVSYEIFNDPKNSRLLDDVSKFMDGKSATGVPYIVIGDTAFGGFNESTDGDAIKAKIKDWKNIKILFIPTRFNDESLFHFMWLNTSSNELYDFKADKPITMIFKSLLFRGSVRKSDFKNYYSHYMNSKVTKFLKDNNFLICKQYF